MHTHTDVRIRLREITQLIGAIFICQLAGVIGSVFTTPSITNYSSTSDLSWYAQLIKPSLNPPAWIFGPVWVTLFTLMGVALFLVWRTGLQRQDVRRALALFVGQLLLNISWSIIFFGLRNPGAAFAEIIILWFVILATIIAFIKISKPAAWLLVPYIVWVSFAGYLNGAIWALNQPSTPPQHTPVATMFDGKNSTFTIDGIPVTLVNAISVVPNGPHSSARTTTRYFGNEATGDLTGDGLSDTAFIVTRDTGGSGTFYYVVVAIQTATGYRYTNAFFIGDRIAPQSTYIPTDSRELHVNYAERRPGEPFTANPSVGATLLLKVTPEGVLEGLMK
jgi:tryptophan-rich sensory protein